jgi:hypothetical protein
VESSSQTVAMMYASTNNEGRFLPGWNGRRTQLQARTRTFESLASVQRMKYPSVGNNGIRLKTARSQLIAAANSNGADPGATVRITNSAAAAIERLANTPALQMASRRRGGSVYRPASFNPTIGMIPR